MTFQFDCRNVSKRKPLLFTSIAWTKNDLCFSGIVFSLTIVSQQKWTLHQGAWSSFLTCERFGVRLITMIQSTISGVRPRFLIIESLSNSCSTLVSFSICRFLYLFTCTSKANNPIIILTIGAYLNVTKTFFPSNNSLFEKQPLNWIILR